MDDKLFIVGGRDGYKTLNSVECFNLNTKSWQSMPALSTHRHGVGVVLLEGIFQKIPMVSVKMNSTRRNQPLKLL